AFPDGTVTAAKISDNPAEQASIWSKIKQLIGIGDLSDAAAADLRMVDPNGPRIPVGYHGDYTVQIAGIRSIAMGGFRINGRYTESRSLVFDLPAPVDPNRHLIDLGNSDGTIIPNEEGTIIGDMTASAGQGAAFDGQNDQ